MEILRPYLTKKSVALNKQGKYVFVVDPKSNKIEIKRAIETRYDVLVTQTNTRHTYGKRVTRHTRKGRTIFGKKKNKKLAEVTLRKGDSIDLSQTLNV